jgi:hypothetical protein
MRQLIAAALVTVAVILAWPFDDITAPMRPQPRTFESAPPKSYLGREFADPDNWQAQTQKKEESFLCPPICPDIIIAGVQQKGRWHNE